MQIRRKLRWQLIGLGLFALIVGGLSYPNEMQLLRPLGINTDLSVQRGLDLRGGVYLVYQADIPEGRDTEAVLSETVARIQNRVNPTGASEAVVRAAQNDQVTVQIPDEDDPQAVIELIGQTAQLEFFEFVSGGESVETQLVPTEVSGEDVAEAEAVFDQFGRPVVSLQFESGESTQKFAEMSTRIYNSGTQVLAMLDGLPIFGPVPFQQPILTGESQLTGSESIQEAQETATLLNSGALPAPIELVAQQTIGPSLGANALQASLVAGAVGLLALVLFMLVIYRLGGAVAVAMIGLYAASMITVFKLSVLPIFGGSAIVLTLAGIAGFIMSIAVAADANILVLERLREERSSGLAPVKAVEAGFNHAWSSIRDASTATLIICVLLYQLATEPAIQGFALVLGIGVIMNVLAVAVVTRTLLRGVARTKLAGRL
ncbi:MAG: preprotein translocase subunit SecD [Candidatus Saccharimonadales bacterium]